MGRLMVDKNLIREQFITVVSNEAWNRVQTPITHNQMDGVVRTILDILTEKGLIN